MGKKYITQKDTKNADFDEIDIALADLSLSNKKSSKHRKECTTSSCTKFVLVKDSSHDTELMLDEMINTLHMINNSLYFMKKADDTVVTVNGFCNQIYDVIET
jgi:hypothetical protein